MADLLQIENLSAGYGEAVVLNGVNAALAEGETLALLGRNGVGKSTTIRMLLSLIHPSSGSIELFGKSIQKNRASILEQVGAIIERPDLYPYLTATEHLQLFAKVRKKKIEASNIQNTLEKVGLAGRAQDKVQTFSLGMKQRLGIAIALVHNPSLIILDEPTNGLDPQGIADIRNLILNLSREQGKTVLVSSHLLSEIEQVATRLIIIDKGCKLVEGDSKELFDTSKTVVAIQTLDNKQATELLLQSSWAAQLLVNRSTDKEIFIGNDKKNLEALRGFFN